MKIDTQACEVQRNKTLMGLCLLGTLGFVTHSVWAQYPVFYDDEDPVYGNVTVPAPGFTEEGMPIVCEADDEDCINAYLAKYGDNVQGGVNAQMTPSPVYTWRENQCILGSAEACAQLDLEWQQFHTRAEQGGLDFAQGADQTGDLTCYKEYDWWGMQYVYKCHSVD